MLYNGIKFSGPRLETLVIPRGQDKIVIKAQAVYEFSEFDTIVVEPVAPKGQKPGGPVEMLTNDPKYVKELNIYFGYKSDWIILKSLEATEQLQWETVDMTKPETWANFKIELVEAGFSQLEIANIINLVNQACGLDQDKIDEATKSFLAGREEEKV